MPEGTLPHVGPVALASDLTLGDKVLALKLLETARLTTISKQLILTSTQNLTFAEVKKSFLKIMKNTSVQSESQNINLQSPK